MATFRKDQQKQWAYAPLSILLIIALACIPLLFGIPFASGSEDAVEQQAPATSDVTGGTPGAASNDAGQAPAAPVTDAGQAPAAPVMENTQASAPVVGQGVAQSAEATAPIVEALSVPDGLALDETNFPDPALRTCLMNMLDRDENGYISDTEMGMKYTKIISGMDITNLKGAELLGEGNLFIEDTSATLIDMTGTKAYSVDINRNPNLQTYIIKNAPNTNFINARGNPRLTKIEFGNLGMNASAPGYNDGALFVNVSENDLRKLDFTGTTLGYLDCWGNPNLTELTGINSQPSLSHFNADYCALTSLNVSGCPKLVGLNAPHNQLSYLDVTGNTRLVQMRVDNNGLLDVRGLNSALASWVYPQDYVANNQELTIPLEYNKAKGKYISINTYNVYNESGNINLIRWETPKPAPQYDYIYGEVDYGGWTSWEIIDVVEIPSGWVDAPDVVIGFYDAATKRFVMDGIEDANFSIKNNLSTLSAPSWGSWDGNASTSGTIHFTGTPPVPEDPKEETPEVPVPPVTPPDTPGGPTPPNPINLILTPVYSVASSFMQAATGAQSPLGQVASAIDDNTTPLAGGHGTCYVHFYMIAGMLATIFYTVVVVARRRRSTFELEALEEEAMGIRQSKDAYFGTRAPQPFDQEA